MNREQSAVRGMLWGMAVGDALGYPVEFLKLPEIYEKHGPQGVREFPQPGLYSDDTQMTLAVARALVERGEGEVDEIMDGVIVEFLAWKKLQEEKEHRRAPGNTCMAGVKRLEEGYPWRESGLPDSAGCGSAMRISPAGYLYSQDLDKMTKVAHAVGICTHGSAHSDASCRAAAYLVKLSLDQIPLDQYIPCTLEYVGGLSSTLDEKLALCHDLVSSDVDEDDALAQLGEGWVGPEAVALALYCFLIRNGNLKEAVLRGATTNGDSDSIAAIAGSLAGARSGEEAVPRKWLDHIEDREYLEEMADSLWKKKQSLYYT